MAAAVPPSLPPGPPAGAPVAAHPPAAGRFTRINLPNPSVVSDTAGLFRNGINAISQGAEGTAAKVSSVAQAVLGTVGGAANVLVGTRMALSGLSEVRQATDTEGRVEGSLRMAIGVSLALVGLGMLLFFTAASISSGGLMILIAGLIMYSLVAIKGGHGLYHLYQFRSELLKQLEVADDTRSDEGKVAQVFDFLEEQMKSPAELERRVGKRCKEMIEVFFRDIDRKSLQEKQALIDELSKENVKQITSRILLLLIAVLGLPAFLLGGIIAPLLFVLTNILWLFLDHDSLKLWMEEMGTEAWRSFFHTPYWEPAPASP